MVRKDAGAFEFLDGVAKSRDEARLVAQGRVVRHLAALAETVHDEAQEADTDGVEQEREGLSRAGQQFGVQRVKGVDFHPQRATRSGEAFAKVICLNGIGNDGDDGRKRLLRQHLPHALDDALGLAVACGGEEEASHWGTAGKRILWLATMRVDESIFCLRLASLAPLSTLQIDQY